MATLSKELLIAALAMPLPGISAHIKMAPAGRNLNVAYFGAKQSAVLMLFTVHDSELSICLIKRSSLLKHHPGQISFPGGRKEESDNSPIDTALRETSEEIGVSIKSIEVLGMLSRLYVPVSNFEIEVVVGWINEPPQFILDRNEVDELFLIPFRNFIDNESIVQTIMVKDNVSINAPCYKIDNKIIWGATAMIISELTSMLTMVD